MTPGGEVIAGILQGATTVTAMGPQEITLGSLNTVALQEAAVCLEDTG